MSNTINKQPSKQPCKQDILSQCNNIIDSLKNVKCIITNISNDVKILEKSYVSKIKKANKKNKNNTNKKKLSGFATPIKISKELSNFMNLPEGQEIARTDVTKYIIQYIKDHNLPDKDNKKKINPNNKLQSLLDVKKNEEVTYFNLQRYMNKHFIQYSKKKDLSNA